MRRIPNAVRRRLTRANARWFVRVNVCGWLAQAAIAGVLTALGVGPVSALVAAKVTNWAVFLGQLARAARTTD